MNQTTLKDKIIVSGVGLHTGRPCRAVLNPAAENTGVEFVRTDLPEQPVFKANLGSVVDIVRGTTLGEGEARVYTIEHLLSALHGLDVDNVRVELDDNEPPVGDGSANLFTEMILKIGKFEQSTPRAYVTVDTPFEYQANQTVIRIEPSEHFEIQCEIDYNHPLLKNQSFLFKAGDDYAREISPARTYCFDYEIEALVKQGLAKGGSLDNAIVIGPAGIYNPDSRLRFENEFVRHKILDLMGDLFLLGRRIKAKVVAKRSGHGHNIKFLRQFLQERPLPQTTSV